ncbi:hypothetical protein PORCRE_59 [Porphyromonas crevioricanis JCM 15906]|uniref:Uncharacterized protein n=1 Tax=Porphyromonas crevioricanis JCM 15906 TaxID=1305617 RepID=S4NAY8_9PORP|nr:hypothetical protein PORCRE_59 [Porphyromonas crevioricanis JCM 15906]GAD07798.1 hypothetical protein PORCAN_1426 [Porphyromonas crevioricanis JCM 13913]
MGFILFVGGDLNREKGVLTSNCEPPFSIIYDLNIFDPIINIRPELP